MERYYIFKDNTLEASTATRDAAITLIRTYQAQETHPFIRSGYSIIKGEQEFMPYPSTKTTKRRATK